MTNAHIHALALNFERLFVVRPPDRHHADELKDESGEPLNVGRKTRAIPPALRRALESRDGGCRFPSCTHTKTEGHHIVHWANGGKTKLSNLVSLCKFHHRLIHEGGFTVEVTDDGVLVFRLGNGKPLAHTGSGLMAGSGAYAGGALRQPSIYALNHGRGITIDPETIHSRWDGTKMDYGWAVEALLMIRDRRLATDGLEGQSAEAA